MTDSLERSEPTAAASSARRAVVTFATSTAVGKAGGPPAAGLVPAAPGAAGAVGPEGARLALYASTPSAPMAMTETAAIQWRRVGFCMGILNSFSTVARTGIEPPAIRAGNY